MLQSRKKVLGKIANVEFNTIKKTNTFYDNSTIFTHGKTIKGEMFLEVPVQNVPIPKNTLDLARANKVKIIDTTGKVYL